MMSLQQACRQNYSLDVRFAVLVHDLGKALTPLEELPRHIMHEERGIKPVNELCERLKCRLIPSNWLWRCAKNI